MLQYTNGFSCALSNDSGELIIKFFQQTPIVKENKITPDIKIEEVTEVIMPNNIAKQLANGLMTIMSKNEI
jgi:hypothetical protein